MIEQITQETIKTLLPEYDQSISVNKDGYHGLMMAHEVDILVRLAKAINARTVFEFGTYAGYTTRVLAERFERVYTVDYYKEMGNITPEQAHETQSVRHVGIAATGLPNVTQLLHDTLSRKAHIELLGRYTRKMNMVFVDAGHHFIPCLNDSLLALALVSVPGLIVWHDFKDQDIGQDVMDVVEMIGAISAKIYHISGTWLAFMIV